MTLFVSCFIPPCDVSESIVKVSACVSSYFAYRSDHSPSMKNLIVKR